MAELAHVVEPGGRLDRLGVGPGQRRQSQGQGGDDGDVLPTVVERHLIGAVAAAEFG